MGIFDNTVIVSDLDGTLVPLGAHIAAEDKAAIRYFRQQGGLFTVATGRTPGAALPYLEGIELHAPGIYFNGGMLYDSVEDRVLAMRALPEQERWHAFASVCLRELPHACIEVYTAGGCNILSAPVYDDPRLAREHFDFRHVSIEAIAEETWIKFFICAEPETLRSAVKLADMCGMKPLSESFYSDTHYYEFVARGTSKGAMLGELRRQPGFTDKFFVAAGDFINDNEMLREAYLGIAAVNADPATKAVADLVGVPCEKHLMAWIIEKLPSILDARV